jgi:hypothetical protein
MVALAVACRAAWRRKSYAAQLRAAIGVLSECLALEAGGEGRGGEGAA